MAPEHKLTSKQASPHPCTAYARVKAAHDMQTEHCLSGICPPVLNDESMGTHSLAGAGVRHGEAPGPWL